MEEVSVLEQARKMASGEMNARALSEYYLQRIETLDTSTINSVIEVNPEALAIADERDRERSGGRVRGPLHGIPILIKDNIDTRDRMQTTAGALARSACGSSSGSAGAVAADFCAAAVGTETDGSIICPSQTCGVVGLKPTLGLISRSGIIPVAHSQDTAGPIGRTVEDVAVLLGCLAGVDPRDPITQSKRRRAYTDYTRFLKKDGLKGARIGVARNMLGSDARLVRILESCLDVMQQLGAVIVDPADLPNMDTFGKTELEVLYFEFKADLNKYLGALGPSIRVHSLEDVIKFNEENKDRMMPHFGQERMTAAQAKGPLSSKKYRKALARNHRLTRKEGIDALLKKERLEAVVAISGGPAWTIDLANGDPRSWDMESTSPAAVAGYPHLTVPAGDIHGLPIGLSFFTRAWGEPTLLRLAFAFEQASHARKSPRFLKTARFKPA